MNSLARNTHRELSSASFRPALEKANAGRLPLRIRCALLESLRQELQQKLAMLHSINEHYREIPPPPKIQSPMLPQPTEAELWSELDDIELQIMERRDEKILLGSVLEHMDDQLFEQVKILEFKERENRRLKEEIETKRKKVESERLQRFAKDNSLSINSTGISSASVSSPRMPSSPRLLGSPRLARIFNWG